MSAGVAPSIAVNLHSLSFVPSADQKWDFDVFMNEFQTVVTSSTQETIEFDLINIDCTFANAIRRILVAEVPSFAIERVYMHQNTSVIADETFCHRLGLVPLNVDPEQMAFCLTDLPDSDDISGFDPNSHLLFNINENFDCRTSKGNTDVQSKEGLKVFPLYSSSLTWVPLPGQKESFKDDSVAQPGPVSKKILLNKLGPGDQIVASCLAIKGLGRDHAKFSPVSVAFYRLLPSIEITKTVRGKLAKKLQNSFAKGVIHVDPQSQTASVANARLDNGSREHLRHPDLASIVHVSLNPRHFIFTVESIAPGYRSPDALVKCAIDVMLSKCAHYLTIVGKAGFAANPTSNSNIDFDAEGPSGVEATMTSLNGRNVGLEAIFVSNDLRRATFRFTGEDHTLGAALRHCILRSGAVKLCGYCQPHPLEDSITFEIQSKDEVAVVVLQNGFYCLRACFEHIKRKFKSAMKKVQKQAS